MKKFMWTWAICVGILTSLYGLIFSFTPMNSVVPGGYLWISLCALSLYFCEGADIKLFPNYVCSALAGLIWGFCGVLAAGFLISSGYSSIFATCSILLVIPLCGVGIHMILLEKTWLNKVSMIFATVAFVFSQNGQNLWQIALSILGGFLLGIAVSMVGAFLRKKMLPAKENALHQ